MKKKSLFIVLLLCCLPSLIWAQSIRDRPDLTFGPKLGYTFGKNGGFTWGIEFTYFLPIKNYDYRFGITFDYTAWGPSNVSFHLGGEVLVDDAVGIDIGPTVAFIRNRTSIGVSGIVFGGIVAYPYYEYLILPENDYSSIGTYIKFPVIGKVKVL